MATVNEKMTAIADNIRDKTGGTEALTLDDMASGVNEVYEAGYNQHESDWWDAYQRQGSSTMYSSAFANGIFTDELYKPKYPLRGVMNNTFSQSLITDVKVPILAATSILQMLRWNSKTKRIPELNISETTNVSSDPFYQATALTDIKLTGVLAKSLSFAYSPLSVASMKSIISCLKDYSGTENEFKYTVSFTSACKTALDAEGNTSPNGNTWRQYASDLGWNC